VAGPKAAASFPLCPDETGKPWLTLGSAPRGDVEDAELRGPDGHRDRLLLQFDFPRNPAVSPGQCVVIVPTHADACEGTSPSVTSSTYPRPEGAITTEIREAVRRILRHITLLIACAALGLVIPWAASQGRSPSYVANMRVLITGGTAVDQSKATSLADTVAAIATSRSQLGSALRDVGAHDDPGTFKRNIAVQPVGSSGIVDLSVTDADPVAAAAIANALTSRVVELLREARIASNPLIIDSASPGSVQRISSTRNQDLAFGAVLGLVVGLVAAALAEAVSPTIVGKDAIGTEFGAPVLGTLPSIKRVPAPRELSWLRWQLDTQAQRIGVATAELTAVGRSVDLGPLARALADAKRASRPSSRRRRRAGVGARATAEVATTAPPPEAGPGNRSVLAITILDPKDPSSVASNGSAGVVIVAPASLKRADIDPVNDLLAVTGWPLLGVVAYGRGLRGTLGGLGGRLGSATRGRRARNFLPWRQQP